MDGDELAGECRNLPILTEGFPTYGGRPAATSRRWREECASRRPDYLRYWIPSTGTSARLCSGPECRCLRQLAGTPFYVDALALLPQIPPLEIASPV